MSKNVSETTSIAIIDDHALFREGLRQIIEKRPEYAVVGEASTMEEGVALVQKEKPDVILLDIIFRNSSRAYDSGLLHVGELKRVSPESRILVLSGNTDGLSLKEAVRNGADGYATKESASEMLLFAIKAILAGDKYFDGNVVQAALGELKPASKTDGKLIDGEEKLSPREREVLNLFKEGLNNKKIGERLFICAKTVEVHKRNIKEKLGFDDYTQMMRRLLKDDDPDEETEPC